MLPELIASVYTGATTDSQFRVSPEPKYYSLLCPWLATFPKISHSSNFKTLLRFLKFQCYPILTHSQQMTLSLILYVFLEPLVANFIPQTDKISAISYPSLTILTLSLKEEKYSLQFPYIFALDLEYVYF